MNRRLKKLLAESMLCIDAKLIPAVHTVALGLQNADARRKPGIHDAQIWEDAMNRCRWARRRALGLCLDRPYPGFSAARPPARPS